MKESIFCLATGVVIYLGWLFTRPGPPWPKKWDTLKVFSFFSRGDTIPRNMRCSDCKGEGRIACKCEGGTAYKCTNFLCSGGRLFCPACHGSGKKQGAREYVTE